MVCKVKSISGEIFKINTLIKKVQKRPCKGDIKKMSALNNLRKKGTSLTLGETKAFNESSVSGPAKPAGRGVHTPVLLYKAKKE